MHNSAQWLQSSDRELVRYSSHSDFKWSEIYRGNKFHARLNSLNCPAVQETRARRVSDHGSTETLLSQLLTSVAIMLVIIIACRRNYRSGKAITHLAGHFSVR